MKYLKILLQPIKIKGDPDDEDTLQSDLYEHIQHLIDTESLKWEIEEDENEDQDEND